MFGVAEVKPRVFQDIDDKLCQMRIDFNDKFKEAADANTLGQERNQMIFDRLSDFEKTLSNIDELMRLRDGQIGDLNLSLSALSTTTSQKCLVLTTHCQKLEAKIESDISKVEQSISNLVSQLTV